MNTFIICLPNVALSKGSGKQRLNYRIWGTLKNALTSSLLQLLQRHHSLKKSMLKQKKCQDMEGMFCLRASAIWHSHLEWVWSS